MGVAGGEALWFSPGRLDAEQGGRRAAGERGVDDLVAVGRPGGGGLDGVGAGEAGEAAAADVGDVELEALR